MNKKILSQRLRPAFGKNKYRGVNLNNLRKKWQVNIKINGVGKYFGSFKTEEEGRIAVKGLCEIFSRASRITARKT